MDTVDAIRTRRSIRSYLDRPIDRSLIEEVIRDAAQAPVTPLSEPRLFTVIEGARFVAACGDRAMEYARRNRPDRPGYDWIDRPGFSVFHGAPAVIVISAPAINSQSFGDCVRSGQNLLLSAHARGLGACWVGAPMLWLEDPGTKAELGISAEYHPYAAFATGYPAETPADRPRDLPRTIWIDGAGER
jgi:nitroreductase